MAGRVAGTYSFGGIETMEPGVGPILGRIRPGRTAPDATAGGGAPAGGRSSQAMDESGINPIVGLWGFLALAVLLWVARKNSSYLQGQVLGVNFFNVVAVGVLASIWILFSKIIFNRIPVPGLTPAVNAL